MKTTTVECKTEYENNSNQNISSTVNNYYDGLNLCRYKTQDLTGQNPDSPCDSALQSLNFFLSEKKCFPVSSFKDTELCQKCVKQGFW